ncbi:MAG: hypothetical protein LBV55_02745 [Acholeplasmatales bacterium]|jgi:hypothetical protein|nr:hypothetical protein [Acholeplasmatales bacterium]
MNNNRGSHLNLTIITTRFNPSLGVSLNKSAIINDCFHDYLVDNDKKTWKPGKLLDDLN